MCYIYSHQYHGLEIRLLSGCCGAVEWVHYYSCIGCAKLDPCATLICNSRSPQIRNPNIALAKFSLVNGRIVYLDSVTLAYRNLPTSNHDWRLALPLQRPFKMAINTILVRTTSWTPLSAAPANELCTSQRGHRQVVSPRTRPLQGVLL